MEKIDKFDIAGAEIKLEEKSNTLIVGFSSQEITNSQLFQVLAANEDFFLTFYGCDPTNSDLSIITNSKISKIAIIYSKLTNKQLEIIVKMKNINKIKLFDTQISKNEIEAIKKNNPEIDFS